jgi:hypothetical protein
MFGYQRRIFSSSGSDGVHPLVSVEQGRVEERRARYQPRDAIAAVDAEVSGYLEVDEHAEFSVLEIQLLLSR